MKTFVYATCQQEGLHKWPKAPTSVSYLRYAHRHIFHVKAYVEVVHDNREVEFITLKNFVHAVARAVLCDGQSVSMSCEQLAAEFVVALRACYGDNRDYIVVVSEDDENGAVVYKQGTQSNSEEDLHVVTKQLGP